MFDALTDHLNLGTFVIALAGHLIAESSAKFSLNGARYLGYLAAVAMLPVLMRLVERHQRSGEAEGVRRGAGARQRNSKRK